jgi:hypothetical protein
MGKVRIPRYPEIDLLYVNLESWSALPGIGHGKSISIDSLAIKHCPIRRATFTECVTNMGIYFEKTVVQNLSTTSFFTRRSPSNDTSYERVD